MTNPNHSKSDIRKLLRTLAIVVLGTCTTSTVVLADNTGGVPDSSASVDAKGAALDFIDQQSQNKGIFTFDYGVPSSPASQLVSAAPTKFKTSTPLKPYVISLPTAWGGAQGADSFAADFSPIWLFDSGAQTYAAYKRDSDGLLSSIVTRFRIGGALTPGLHANGVKSKQVVSRGGIGISTSLLDADDPALTPDPKNPNQTYWDGCIASLKLGVGAKYDAALNSRWGVTPNLLAQLVASIADAARQAKTPSGITPGTAAAVYRFMDRCLNDAICSTTDTDRKLQTIHDSDKASGAITSGQLQVVTSLVQKMKAIVDASNGVLLADFAKGINTCVANANLLAEHAPALDVGAGVEWQGLPGKIKDFSQSAEVVWLGGRYPLSSVLRAQSPLVVGTGGPNGDPMAKDQLDYFMIGGSVRAAWNEMSTTGDKTTPQIRANTLQAWGGIERSTSGSEFAAQIGYSNVHATSAALSRFSKSGVRWLASGSLKFGDTLQDFVGHLLSDFGDDQSLTNGVWLNISYGTANGTSTTLKDKTFLVSLNFSETPDSTLGDGPPTGAN